MIATLGTTNTTAAYWELVGEGRLINTFAKNEFQQAMAAAARARTVGIKCDVRRIVEGR